MINRSVRFANLPTVFGEQIHAIINRCQIELISPDVGISSIPKISIKVIGDTYNGSAGTINERGVEIEDVEIISPGDSCPVCELAGKETMTLTEALEKKPLPVSGCEHASCRCSYAPVLEEVVPPLV